MTPSLRRPRPTPIQPPQRPPRAPLADHEQPLDSGASSLALFIAVAGLSFVVGSLVTLQFAPIDASAGSTGLGAEVTRSASDTLAPLAPSGDDMGPTVTGEAVTAVVATAIRQPILAAVEVPSRSKTQIAVSALTEASVGLRLVSQSAAQRMAGQSDMRVLTETALGDLNQVRAAQPVSAETNVPTEAIQTLVEEAAASDPAPEPLPEPEVQYINGERYYTVGTGDSLAYIALIFFGNTGAYQQIFEANRDLLESPDHVEVGMRLRIPDA